MRVLHVVLSNRIGGVQRRLHTVAPLLRAQYGIESAFLVRDEPGDFSELMRQAGFDVIAMTVRNPSMEGTCVNSCLKNLSYLGWLSTAVLHFMHGIQRTNAGVVHVNGLLGWPAVLAARIVGRPVAWHLISDMYPRVGVRILQPIISRLANRIIVTAASMAAYYGAHNAVIVREPADARFFSTPGDRLSARLRLEDELGHRLSGFLISAIGNISPVKGYEYLIDALDLLAKHGVTCTCIVVGDIPAGREQYAQTLALRVPARLRDRVLFLGFREDVMPILDASGLFVVSSVHEGTPVAILEAMARGLPVVATKVGGIPELLADGTAGVLVPARDAQALAQAMLRVINDRQFRHTLGSESQRRARNLFHPERCTRDLAAIYQELAGDYL